MIIIYQIEFKNEQICISLFKNIPPKKSKRKKYKKKQMGK